MISFENLPVEQPDRKPNFAEGNLGRYGPGSSQRYERYVWDAYGDQPGLAVSRTAAGEMHTRWVERGTQLVKLAAAGMGDVLDEVGLRAWQFPDEDEEGMTFTIVQHTSPPNFLLAANKIALPGMAGADRQLSLRGVHPGTRYTGVQLTRSLKNFELLTATRGTDGTHDMLDHGAALLALMNSPVLTAALTDTGSKLYDAYIESKTPPVLPKGLLAAYFHREEIRDIRNKAVETQELALEAIRSFTRRFDVGVNLREFGNLFGISNFSPERLTPLHEQLGTEKPALLAAVRLAITSFDGPRDWKTRTA